MRCIVLALAALFVVASAAWAADPEVRVEARVKPAEGVVVGQRAALEVKILTSAVRFGGSPTLPEPRVPHTIVRRLDTTSLKGTERVDGESWIYQIWTYDLWPTRPGRHEVPSVEVGVRLPGEDRDPRVVPAATSPLELSVSEPEGADGAVYAFAATGFVLAEELDRDFEGLRVGDAVQRTVTMTVEDAPGMLIPPLASGEWEGLGTYAETPTVDDLFARGRLTGTRAEAVTYVMEREGHFELPEIRIPWWNLETNRVEEAVIEPRAFEVAPNPDLDPEQLARLRGQDEAPDGAAPGAGRIVERVVQLLPLLVVVVVLLLIPWRRVDDWIEAERREHHESEPAYFKRFSAACRSNDPARARQALRAWLDCTRGPSTTIDAWLNEADDGALTREVRGLQATLYGDGVHGAWSGEGLRAAVDGTRGRRRHRGDGTAAELRLNPGP